jgi:hypothetical protein
MSESRNGDHMSVGVEIYNVMEGHHHQMSEVQYIEFAANGDFEMTQIVIDNVDSGFFKLVFIHPTDLEEDPWATEDMSI